MDIEPHLEALTQYVAGRLTVAGASAAAYVKVLMDSVSGITAMSEELVQLGMMQTTLTQAFVRRARVVTSLDQECYIVTQSCPLHFITETPWEPVRFTLPFIALSGGGDVVIGQKTLIENLGIDVMSRLFRRSDRAAARRATWTMTPH